jgi:hypothetical protein
MSFFTLKRPKPELGKFPTTGLGLKQFKAATIVAI